MSGPLASWAAHHSKASYRGRAVLMQYALAANHDGTPAADVTREDLKHRTGLGQMTVVKGRAEVIERKELEELEAPGGRGKVGRYRVVVALCPDGEPCWSCDALAKALKRRRPTKETVRLRDGFEGAPSVRNRPPQSRNRPPGGPTTERHPLKAVGDAAVQAAEDQTSSAAVASGGAPRASYSLPQPGTRGATVSTSPPRQMPGPTPPPPLPTRPRASSRTAGDVRSATRSPPNGPPEDQHATKEEITSPAQLPGFPDEAALDPARFRR